MSTNLVAEKLLLLNVLNYFVLTNQSLINFLISNLISLKSVEGCNPSIHKLYKRIPYQVEKEQRFRKLEN
jgi:hypothetical protein